MADFGPNDLLDCYARGVFPMADSRDDPRIYLHDPDMRGIIPLDGLRISKSLQKHMRKSPYHIEFNKNFSRIVDMCAQSTTGREDTWINDGIKYLYAELHAIGHAHSVECYAGDRLVGGLYGISLGGAFFGESMFSRATDASKIALVALVERLNARGYSLLDTQFITPHLRTLGAIEIPRSEYHKLLKNALKIDAVFDGNKS
ncbi:MAG: leucyl/phenylalanyl-tRNA--protein transferase [Robiginitomaculum sp.]